MLRWVQIQADHIGSLGLEVGIIRGDVALEPMRLQAVLGPNSRDRHVRDVTAQFGGQLARGPVRRTVGRLALRRPAKHARLDPVGHLVALPSAVSREQPRQTIGFEAFAPATDVAVSTIELDPDLGPGQSLGKQQDQPSVSCRIGTPVSCARLTLEFHPFALGQFHHALRRHDATTDLIVTVH